MGIEPTAQAWEAWVLPLYDARYPRDSRRVPQGRQMWQLSVGAVLAEIQGFYWFLRTALKSRR
jgi:hypothetical protein